MKTVGKPIIEKYLKYPPVRDVVFVFGAGASHPDGVPLQRHILPMLLSGGIKEISQSVIGLQVGAFIRDNFYVDTKASVVPGLEAVFGFLDYFIHRHESLNARYNYTHLQQIKENLIKIIHYIVNLQTENMSPTYSRFWQAVHTCNRNVSVITLNYDTLLEQAFNPLFRKEGYLDYCIHLMNYETRPELREYHFWVNPREPVPVDSAACPSIFKVIKLHGSLNWKYCNCCNQTLLTTWHRKIDLNRGTFVGYTQPDQKEYDYCCPLDSTEFQTLIMPPSYIKSLNNPMISQLFSEASREIRAARRIVFIGYSLSDADVHIKALFRKHLGTETHVVVVNPKHTEALRHRYHSLSPHVRFLPFSFEELVADDLAMKRLLCID